MNVTLPLGGSGNYEYSIDGGRPLVQATSLNTGPYSGSYDVRIRDAVNTACEITLNRGDLILRNHRHSSGTVVKTNITCFNAK